MSAVYDFAAIAQSIKRLKDGTQIAKPSDEPTGMSGGTGFYESEAGETFKDMTHG